VKDKCKKYTKHSTRNGEKRRYEGKNGKQTLKTERELVVTLKYE
jgi:hypothetical protein